MPKFKQLMFIDDDRATNVFHRIIVEESGLCEEAIFFDSAVKAVEHFKALMEKPAPYQLPDIIFLDINMPVMNGWEFLEEYKELGLPSTQFIIMLTTSLSSMDAEKAEGIELIHKLMNKPLEEGHLKALLEESLAIS